MGSPAAFDPDLRDVEVHGGDAQATVPDLSRPLSDTSEAAPDLRGQD